MIKISIKLLLIIGLVSPVLAEAEQAYYTVNGTNKNIVFGVTDEALDEEISEFDYQGFSSPVQSLITFFYFGKTGELKNLIDMHYAKDGSQQYMKELLLDDPESFSGAKDLASIKLIKKYFIGKQQILLFEMHNKNGAKARWFDSFICENNNCSKSYSLSLFSRSELRDMFNRFLGLRTTISVEPQASYLRIVFDGNKARDVYPFELFLNVNEITSDNFLEPWYIKLNKIKLLEQYDDKQLMLTEYIPGIFSHWEDNTTVNFDFDTMSIEKEWLINNLSNIHDFNIKGYLDTDEVIWIYASAQTYDNKKTYFLFAYDKKPEKFIMKSSRNPIGRALMTDSVRLSLFNLEPNSGAEKEHMYIAKKEDKLVRDFYDELPLEITIFEGYGIIFGFILVVLVLVIVLFIRGNKRRRKDQ